MDNRADTQFRGEEQNTTNDDNTTNDNTTNEDTTNQVENNTSQNELRTTLKYRATMTFTQYIPPEEETTT